MSPDGVSEAQRTKTLGESAGGGLYSTPADLYRFVTALEDGTLLGEAMREALFAAHAETRDGHEGYAFSVKAFGPNPIRFAAGSGYGTKSVVVRDPAAGDFIGIVSNWGNTPILDLLRDLFLALNGQSVEPPSADRLADPDDYRPHFGRYAFDDQALRTALQADDDVIRLHESGGRLFMDDELMARGAEGALTLTYTDELVIRVGDGALTLEVGGKKLVGQRVD
jgi:CubicO group peptidase (beta-lactamase class C family)